MKAINCLWTHIFALGIGSSINSSGGTNRLRPNILIIQRAISSWNGILQWFSIDKIIGKQFEFWFKNRINRERNMTRTNKRKRDSTDDVDAILKAVQDELDSNETTKQS